jgi:hypothetical protein
MMSLPIHQDIAHKPAKTQSIQHRRVGLILGIRTEEPQYTKQKFTKSFYTGPILALLHVLFLSQNPGGHRYTIARTVLSRRSEAAFQYPDLE